MDALDRFSPPTRQWFSSAFAEPTAAQVGGWEAIASGDNTLIHAPTGSGKTLSAFLWAIDRLGEEPTPPERERCRVLYVSPMKALAYDIERNLRAPLTGIQNAARGLGIEPPRISTAMRTGDTPARDRQAMLRHPPDILITTPESLYLMLTSRAREILRTVRWVIVDEIHSVAATKRGSHLSLTLERLAAVTDQEPQRIGLSATQRPLERIAAFLGGGVPSDDGWEPRPVTIVDAPRDKALDIEIVVPVEDMTRPEETPPSGAGPAGDDPARKSIWPAVYPRLLELILSHRSTLLFVNSRGLAERLAAQLNELAGEELVQSHHGSVSREQRIEIEGRLKAGELRGVVATSTLELGIDIAAIDLVVLVESPSSVARGLQRVGRAGHQVGAASVAKVFPKHRGDLLETAVVVDRMLNGTIEETVVPRNPLDVLAQQIVASVAIDDQPVDDLFDLVRRAEPYRDLTRASFDAVLDMLAGRYPSDEFAELRPRIVWDRVEGTISARGNARMLAVTNPGTIPDRGLYRVVLPEGGKVGELDEEMVYESRVGDVFVLGSTSWRISEIDHERVEVVPAPAGSAPRMPFWHGDRIGRPLELGRAVGAFVRSVGALEPDEARRTLVDDYRLDPWAADNLAGFLADERAATGALPTDTTIVIEQFRDEIGDWRTVLLSPFGGRVHAPWALAARRRYRERLGVEVDVIWSDDGIVLRFPDVDEPPGIDELLLDPEEISETILEEVGDSALFTARFREAAARALLLPRRRPGSRTPLWLQRRRAAGLLEIARRYGSFPIVLETYREVLQDYFDLAALEEILGGIRARTIRIHTADVTSPSPFASSLLFDFIASFMYEYDAPVAEKRAAALTLDRSLLRELLGDPEFRDLLDADVIAAVELELQRLAPDYRVDGADATHDLLRHLGPLTLDEVAARSSVPAAAQSMLDRLGDERRIIPVRVGGTERWAAIEDAARLRDAQGVSLPQGVPPALLEPVEDPLGDVVGRFARTHAPFLATEAAASLDLPDAVVTEVLTRLEGSGRVASGSYRPGGTGREWVDTEVLRRLKRRSLAVLRNEVAAVEPDAMGRFLPAWHGVGDSGARPGRLLEIVRRLQGAAIPASVLENDVLGDRMRYSPTMLDDLLASGDVVWLGREPLGTGDGRLSLFLRDQVPLLWTPSTALRPEGTIHDLIRGHLRSRGASFWRDLYAAAEGGDPQTVLDALWDLVWAGEVANDTMAPLRAHLGRRRRSTGRRTLASTTPPAATGRWYLVDDLLADPSPAPEQIATARAELLLERHGVVTRDAVLAEGVAGGFSALYPVFRAMEDAGRVRRGYFVEGLGGAQFATPGAVDRLRMAEATGVVAMAATDPANPYGAALPWPAERFGSRRAGAYVVLVDGRLAAYLERGGRTVTTDPGADHSAIATALASLADTRLPRLGIESVDGLPAADTALGSALLSAGFARGYKGLTRSRPGARSGHRA